MMELLKTEIKKISINGSLDQIDVNVIFTLKNFEDLKPFIDKVKNIEKLEEVIPLSVLDGTLGKYADSTE